MSFVNYLELEQPWLTPKAIDFLNENVQKYDTILEFGTGGSTVYFAKKCLKIVSIEDDELWFKKVQNKLKQKK